MAKPDSNGKPRREHRTRSSLTAGDTTFLRRHESGIWGLGICVLALMLLIALAGYDLAAIRTRDYGNPIGPVGALAAHLLYILVGWVAVLLVCGLGYFGIVLVARKTLVLPWRALLSLALLLWPVATLLQMAFPHVAPHTLTQPPFDPETLMPHGGGGLLGRFFHWVLASLLGQTGTLIVCIGALAAGVCLLFRIHPVRLFTVPARWVIALWSRWRDYRESRESAPDPTGESTPEPLLPVPVRHSGDMGPGSNRDLPDFGDSLESTTFARGLLSPDAAQPEAPVIPLDDPSGTARNTANVSGSVPIILPTQPAADLSEMEGEEEPASPPPRGPRLHVEKRAYEPPDLSLLDYHPPVRQAIDDAALQDSAKLVVEKLGDFKVVGDVVGIHPGPVITLFEFRPGKGVKVAQVANLSKDLAMAVAAEQVRVIAPIPGRDVVGIEIPNRVRETVYLRELLTHKGFKEGKHKLPLALGKDIAGFPVIADLTKMPHLLVAGTTGSGKSVALHAFIMSIVYRLSPEQVRFLFVDPKMLEFTAYAEIPHLLLPVVTEARDAVVALRWAVGEMERRNRTMSSFSVPNITEYNDLVASIQANPSVGESLLQSATGPGAERLRETLEKGELERFPFIIVVIDELADLMMVAGKQVETSVARLAQMARAAGIHMIIATQNPTIKVVTGIIKANMPARLSFKVRTMQDSRVILDQNGSDDLLGCGDMLFLPPGSAKLQRIHGAFVSTEERLRVVEHLRTQGAPVYNFDIMQNDDEDEDLMGADEGDSGSEDLYRKARTIAIQRGKISTSALQRDLGIGYNKAAVLMSRMEKEGLVGPQDSAGKPRIVLASK
jgi:S-DNA-T family DNA segregation ATPase FtsK/SpoIIIE